MSIAMVAVIATTVWQSIKLNNISVDFSSLCHSYYFILPNTINQIVNAVFVFIGFKITRSIGEYNSGQMALIQDEAEVAI